MGLMPGGEMIRGWTVKEWNKFQKEQEEKAMEENVERNESLDLLEEHIHYLKMLRDLGALFQKEIRDALGYAVRLAEYARGELAEKNEKNS